MLVVGWDNFSVAMEKVRGLIRRFARANMMSRSFITGERTKKASRPVDSSKAWMMMSPRKGDIVLQRKGLHGKENPKAVILDVVDTDIWGRLLLHRHDGSEKLNYAPQRYFDLIKR